MSTIKTRNCIICGSPDIAVCGGHVIRKDTYTTLGGLSGDIVIIASFCDKHKNTLPDVNGYYGEYKEWMGMCDNPFKKDVKKLDFTEITGNLLDVIAENDEEFNRQLAQMIGISDVEFNDYLDYARVEKVDDTRDDRVEIGRAMPKN